MNDRAQVKNAADRDQVQRAARRDKDRLADRTELVRNQLATYAGRQFVWEELTRHRLFESITVQSSMIYALSGRRDAGLELLAEVEQHTELFLLMQQEAHLRVKRENATTDAAHTASAQQGAK